MEISLRANGNQLKGKTPKLIFPKREARFAEAAAARVQEF
jgi:hypothetical protein